MAKAKKKTAEQPVVITPNKVGMAVRQAYEVKQASQGNRKVSWEQLNDLSNEIGNYIAQMASDIHESVELVKQNGCDNVAEFNAVVATTNADFERFIADYNKVKQQHEGRSGVISDPDDLAAALQIYENYVQFKTLFEGTMHHSLISFTDYALQAQDRLKEKMSKENDQQPVEEKAE